MPILGMFSKKSKQGKASDVRSMTSAESGMDSPLESPTKEYVRPDKSLPSSPNGRSHLHPQDAMRLPQNSVYPTAGMPVASSSKLRLPFGRKKGSGGSTVSNSNDGHDPRTSIGGVSISDAELPAPRPSFAAYSDPHKGLSTRSLPTNPDSTPPRNQKRPFFNWSKSTNSTPSKPSLQNAKPNLSAPLLSPDSASFNLKAFRHVRPPSPARSVSSTTSLTPPIPPAARPRGASTASDSSQRISVAAFREAQARRSAAGSPAPSLRSSSPHGIPIRSPSPYVMPVHSPGSNPRGGRPVHAPAPRRKSRYLSDSDESEEEEESDDDYGQDEASLSRKRTVTQRRSGNQKYISNTRSEMGHGSRDDEDVPTITPRSPRQRASHSTSALAPSAAAQRAVGLADNARPSRHVREGSTVSNPTVKGDEPRRSTLASNSDSSSSDSDDDAPLARLVPPRRPGSAMSSNSNRSNRSNPSKPLIDINALVGQPPKVSTAAASSSNAGFTPGSTLLSGGIVSRSPPAKFVSPPGSPVKGFKGLAPIDTSTDAFRKSPDLAKRTAPTRKDSDLASTIPRTLSPDEMASPEMGHLLGRAPLRQAPSREVLSPSSSRQDSGVNAGSPVSARPGLTERLKAVAAAPETVLSSGFSRKVGHRKTSSDIPSPRALSTASDGMDDLATMLGGGIRLISMNGESDPSEEEEKKAEESEKQPEVTSSFKPIPIKRRTPAPSFAVTSRPQHKPSESLADTRQRSASMVPSGSPAPALPTVPSPPLPKPRQSPASPSDSMSSGTSSASASTVSSRTSTSPIPVTSSSFAPRKVPVGTPISQRSAMKQSVMVPKPRTISTSTSPTLDAPRQRPALTGPSSTSDLPRQRNSIVMPGSSSTMDLPRAQARPQPANNTIVPRPRSTSMMQLMPAKPFTSPASSTGDSSSGRQPLTPNDGSDIASSATGHSKQRSVSFIEEEGKDKQKKELERRRNEAKASIELGNVVNGRGPIVDDDEDMPVNQGRMSTAMFAQPSWAMPMMNMPMNMPQMNMSQMMSMNPQMMPGMPGTPMINPAQFMPPPGDPAFFAAHQQAMMYAKQAYQIAVAQQAMAAAAEEWERSSAAAFSTAGSVYGGGGGGWGSQSMYGGPSGARSEYGGGGGGWGSSQSMYGGGMSSRSAYGGGGDNRGRQSSAYFPPMPPIPQQQQSSKGAPPKGGSRSRTVSQPASPAKQQGHQHSPSGGKRRGGAPPSSWKPGM